jgi:hypothetical protein
MQRSPYPRALQARPPTAREHNPMHDCQVRSQMFLLCAPSRTNYTLFIVVTSAMGMYVGRRIVIAPTPVSVAARAIRAHITEMKDPVYGCQIGPKHPIVHVKSDQAHPIDSVLTLRDTQSRRAADRHGGRFMSWRQLRTESWKSLGGFAFSCCVERGGAPG